MPGYWDARNAINQRAQGRQGGRALNEDEFVKLAGAVGYAGDGSDVSDDQLNQAYGFVDAYDFGGGAPPPGPAPPPAAGPPPPAPPPGGVTLEVDHPGSVVPPGGVSMERSDDPSPGTPPGVTGYRSPPQQIVPGAAPPPAGFSSAPTPPAAAPSAPAPSAPPAPGAAGANQASINQAVWDRLNQLLTQQYGYDPTKPENRIQLDVNRLNNQRSAERRRASGAERLAQQGISNTSGGFDTMVDQVNADRGMDDATFEADLVRDSLNNQREDINHALQIGAGLMSADQERTLRRELAAIEAELSREGMQIQREGLAQQGALAREGFGLQREGFGVQREGIASQERIAGLDAALRREGLSVQKLLGMGQLGNQLLGMLLDSQLGYDRLGFDFTQLQALLNERAFNYAGGR